MLMFLQEQALPKTMNIMKVHMVNKEMKNLHKEDSRLFSCIKQKKRERERGRERSVSIDRLSSRGYSSDSEQLNRGHFCATSTETLNRMDIIATPRMSRHRLKNAALLRDRRNRGASKERTPTTENGKKESKNQNIELQLKESTKSKKNTMKKLETEYENEGTLTYHGGSESSLCDLAKETSVSSKTKRRTGKGLAESETSDFKDYKVTESDMSQDSLECLDMTSLEREERKKKKRKKPPRREETVLQADRKSRPSLASCVPPLVIPDDSDDSTTDFKRF
ncbi:hypothetical protein QZH41_018006 [Actinostola sp. cb2023]|nr:hypothetical protein QZH41_018006 [Actinostola sp. cb2023]